jgi:pimeloyl-ACP methyl ester carboxylesterase
MGVLIHNNGTIKYDIYGEGSSKPPLVLIHGFCLDSREWEPQIDALVENGHEVITYDMRGFGESSVASGRYSHSEDLEALLNHLGVEKAEICGHSFGGEVAIDFSIKNPDRVEGLILLASSLGSYGGGESPIPNWKKLAQEGKMDTVKEEILLNESLNPLREHTEEFDLVTKMIKEYSGWHFLNEDPGESTWGIVNRLSEIRCPTKIIVGKEDIESSREISAKLKKELLNSELQVVEGTGHFLNLENPKVVNEAINLFAEGKEGRVENKGELRPL